MTHYLTKDGLEKLRKELALLKTETRREVIQRIAAAKELGDLKENAEYADAKEDQGQLESRIAELEATVKDTVVIDEIKHDSSSVTIGSVVSVSHAGKTMQYTIVGSEEADPMVFRISFESPLGKSFLGKRVGEKVVVKAPKGEFEYTIEKIS